MLIQFQINENELKVMTNIINAIKSTLNIAKINYDKKVYKFNITELGDNKYMLVLSADEIYAIHILSAIRATIPFVVHRVLGDTVSGKFFRQIFTKADKEIKKELELVA